VAAEGGGLSAGSLAATHAAVRAGAGLFALPGRGVLEVGGADRVRWLDGMITNDVKALAAAGPGAGCHALLLTRQGRIVTDLHVLLDSDVVRLELERALAAPVRERLLSFVIADDVTCADASGATARLALEGPRAGEALAAAAGAAPALAPDAWARVRVAGHDVDAAAFGFTGLPAFQLLAPAGAAEEVRAALLRAGAGRGLVEADAGLLECLRVEAGTPRAGRELDESALPAEVRLERAVSSAKGCYTGQEVVARMRSRGRVSQLLVGLRFEAPAPVPRAALEREGRRVGELTSAVESPRFGPIGLGFVQRDLAEPGTALEACGVPARVAALPFDAAP
jgi:folate-binding protein YgfZ